MVALRKSLKAVVTVAVLSGISMSTSGCGALVVGYLVADSINKDKATATCRANLQTLNQARIAKNEEPFPDQCAR